MEVYNYPDCNNMYKKLLTEKFSVPCFNTLVYILKSLTSYGFDNYFICFTNGLHTFPVLHMFDSVASNDSKF